MDQWQYDLAAAKQSFKTGGIDDQPTWTTNVSVAHRYSASLDELMNHLPIMVASDSEPARRAYFEKVVQELIRLAYVHTRVGQLSQQPTEPAIANIGQMIKQLAVWLRI